MVGKEPSTLPGRSCNQVSLTWEKPQHGKVVSRTLQRGKGDNSVFLDQRCVMMASEANTGDFDVNASIRRKTFLGKTPSVPELVRLGWRPGEQCGCDVRFDPSDTEQVRRLDGVVLCFVVAWPRRRLDGVVLRCGVASKSSQNPKCHTALDPMFSEAA